MVGRMANHWPTSYPDKDRISQHGILYNVSFLVSKIFALKSSNKFLILLPNKGLFVSNVISLYINFCEGFMKSCQEMA